MQTFLKFLGYNAPSISQIKSLSLSSELSWAGFILLLLALLPIVIWFYKCEGKPVKKPLKRKLKIIRCLFAALIAFLLAKPTLVVSGLAPQKNRLAVMVDTSKSMNIKFNGKSRLDEYKELFQNGFLQRLEEKTGVTPEVFSFSDTVSPVSRQEIKQFAFAPEGNQTDISNSVKNVIENLGDSNIIGVVVLTDGVSTTGETPLTALMNARTPIHFAAPYKAGENIDMAIHLQRPPSVGFLNSALRIRGEISLYMLATSSVPVEIMQNGKHFETVIAKAASASDKAVFGFNIPCEKEGAFRFDVKIPRLPNELTYENNQTAFLLKVVRERLNVLMLSSTPNWEAKFISNALSSDPNAHLVYWLCLNNSKWLCSRNFKVQKSASSADLSDDLKTADVLILCGASSEMLKPIENEIARRVEAGKTGLLIMPSVRSFNELGYIGSSLEKLLLVDAKTEEWHGSTGNMAVSPSYIPLNFLRMVDDPIENAEFYATLPKFDGIYEYGKVKRGAEVLISSTVMGQNGAVPFMLGGKIGLGSVIQVSGGPLWPVGFRLAPTQKGFAPYSAMILNMCKYLANRREDSKVSIELTSSRGYVGQSSYIKTWVLNEKGTLQENALVSLTITGENGDKIVLPGVEASEKGCYETAFIAPSAGLYKIKAEARFQAKELGSDDGELLIEMPTAEYDDPQINEALMRQVASNSNGIFTNTKEAEKLIAAITAEPGQKHEVVSLDIRNSWLFLVLIILLPAIEWYIRRTNGLS